jgi:hypothetical protein
MPKSPIEGEGDDLGEEIGNALGKVLVRYAVILPLLAAAATLPFAATDYLTGAAYSLSPETLDVTLTSDHETPRLKTTEIDEAALRGVIWLRIRTLDKRVPRTD